MGNVVYHESAMTPWTAAYTWAMVLNGGKRYRDKIADSPGRAIIARAITVAGRQAGLLDGGLVATPAVLAPLPVMKVCAWFDPVIKPLIKFAEPTCGHHPTPGEPGYQPYVQVRDAIHAGGMIVADALADEQLLAELDQGGQALAGEVQDAGRAVFNAFAQVATSFGDNVLLAQFGDQLTAYLDQWSPPDDDAQFRTALAEIVGWPDGNPPASLRASDGPWYKIGFSPGGRGRERAAAWCDWLVQRGWATRVDGSKGCWMALPRNWADEVLELGMTMGCASSHMLGWKNWSGDQDRPSHEFLQAHYG